LILKRAEAKEGILQTGLRSQMEHRSPAKTSLEVTVIEALLVSTLIYHLQIRRCATTS